MSANARKTTGKNGLNGAETALVSGLAYALQRYIGVWRLAPPSDPEQTVAAAWSPTIAPDEPEASAESAPISVLNLAAKADQVVAQVQSDGNGHVAMRLGSRSRCFAVAQVLGSELELSTKLFESVAAQQRATTLIADLQEENDAFAAQLSSDLEELTFLRSIVGQLSASQIDESLVEMAQSTLPVLNATIRSRCLCYLQATDPNDPYTAEVAAACGDQVLSERTLSTLVLRHGPSASRGPLIKNWNAESLPSGGTLWSDEESLPGVKSLVLVPLQLGEKHFGWLAAVNRTASSEIGLESSWQLASDEFGSGEASLIATTASILAAHAANRDLLEEKEQLMVSMIRSLVSAIEAKDQYTSGHSERVALYTKRIAEQFGYEEEDADKLYLTALLHDVGKIGVSDAVLKKEGKLSDAEYAEIARHPDEGWAILGDLKQLRYVLPGVLHHHERWDGRGYPDGLAGEDIPLDGRVMAVADAYDAMTSDRPYRKGMPVEKAEAILREGKGSQWDPECVDAFFDCLRDIHRIKAEYRQRQRPVRDKAEALKSPRELVHEIEGIDDGPTASRS